MTERSFLPQLPALPPAPQDYTDEEALARHQEAMDSWLKEADLYMKSLEGWSALEALRGRLGEMGLEMPDDFNPPQQFHEEIREGLQRLLDSFAHFIRRAPSVAPSRKGGKRRGAMRSI